MKTPEQNRAIASRHYYANRDDKLAYQRQYSEQNKESCNAIKTEWAKKNRDKVLAANKLWREKNRAVINEKRKARRHNDPAYKIKDALSTRVRLACKAQGVAKSQSITKLIGCTPQELKLHLESQFVDGMSWDNHGAWHIDHIKPLAAFDLTDTAQQLAAFHWTNMQPLWASDNIAKSDFYPAE